MSQKLHVFTSAAVNYLPKVRALCRSIRRHHPEAVIHLALADEKPDWLTPENEPFDDIMPIDALGIPNWRGWSFFHSIVELSTAIKPFALKRLLSLPDCGAVVYFDPDMVLFSRVDDILERLASSDLVLTPHQTTPESTPEAVKDNEVTSLRMGVYNLGFIGVRNTAEGHRFADWWADRCYEYCRAEVYNGFFTDQKWLNFAPCFFDGCAVIRSPRHNVATWNLTTRRLEGDAQSGYTVDGLPLGFYHFTGFDSGAHRIMAVKNATGNRALEELIGWYERSTVPQKGDPAVGRPWAFARFSDGTRIEPHHRWIYRDRKDLQSAFPDPYATGTGELSFLEWCNTEGRLRFPQFFKDGALPHYPPDAQAVAPRTALKLAVLMMAPRGGKPLRARLRTLVRREGIGGIARRLRGSAG